MQPGCSTTEPGCKRDRRNASAKKVQQLQGARRTKGNWGSIKILIMIKSKTRHKRSTKHRVQKQLLLLILYIHNKSRIDFTANREGENMQNMQLQRRVVCSTTEQFKVQLQVAPAEDKEEWSCCCSFSQALTSLKPWQRQRKTLKMTIGERKNM